MNVKTHILLMMSCASTVPASAENVDVSTLPPRDAVQLTIYNSEDLTLARETRKLTFGRGMNRLQFSWADTLIDPTSVQLRILSHEDELELLDTTFPHDKPQMLYWNVKSDYDGEAAVEITYFTSGLTWSADYVCVGDAAEETLSFEGFVRIDNHSGEDYADARVRLVVGEINLVEKVADLARRGVVSREEEERFRSRGMRLREFAEPQAQAELADQVRLHFGKAAAAPKEIVKEGLSEYFIYTIEGTETLLDRTAKRMRLFEGTKVPFKVQYRYRPAEYGDQLVRLYILRNDQASHLGDTPLPDGTVRVFRRNLNDTLSLLTQQWIKYVPMGQEIELNLGADRHVIHERLLVKAWRDEFWFRRRNLKAFFNPAQGHKIEIDDQLAGWDEHEVWIDRLRNYREKPIDVEIRRTLPGHVLLTSMLSPQPHDYQTAQFIATVQPAEKQDLKYRLTYKRGINEKQNNVTLVEGRPD